MNDQDIHRLSSKAFSDAKKQALDSGLPVVEPGWKENPEFEKATHRLCVGDMAPINVGPKPIIK